MSASMISKKRMSELGCVLGLDCSKYQKDINWAKAKAFGIQFAFIKISEGTTYYEDTKYNVKARAVAAQQNGVKIGYYHFARPGDFENPEVDAQKEVENVLGRLALLPKADLPIVLDLESYSSTVVWDNKVDHMNRFIKKFIAGMAAASLETIFYSYKSFADTNTTPIFGNQALWIAAYVNDPEISLPGIPKGWTGWDIWQFTEKGRIEGYVGNLDLNIMKTQYFNKF